MSKVSKFSTEEKIIITIVQNVVEKLVASTVLYSSKLAYTSAFFLCVIAEEELAKLFFLPICIEIGKLNELAQSIKLFRNHKLKQKISSSLSYFEKNWNQMEEKKQKCLYVSINNNHADLFHIKPIDVYNELNHASLYFLYHMKHINDESRFSKDFIKILLFQAEILGGCMKEKVPELSKTSKQQVDQEVEKLKTEGSRLQHKIYENFLKNPYELIRLFQALFGKTYKSNLEDILGMDTGEMLNYIDKKPCHNLCGPRGN